MNVGLEQMLSEVNGSSVEADWFKAPGDEFPRVALILPHRSQFVGLTFSTHGQQRIVTGGDLRVVHRELRGNHIGARLNRVLGSLACKYGVSDIIASIHSQYALAIKSEVFGEDRLSYFDSYSDALAGSNELPMTYTQAFQSLEHAEPFDVTTEAREIALGVRVALSGLDMSSWEQPIERDRFGVAPSILVP